MDTLIRYAKHFLYLSVDKFASHLHVCLITGVYERLKEMFRTIGTKFILHGF